MFVISILLLFVQGLFRLVTAACTGWLLCHNCYCFSFYPVSVPWLYQLVHAVCARTLSACTCCVCHDCFSLYMQCARTISACTSLCQDCFSLYMQSMPGLFQLVHIVCAMTVSACTHCLCQDFQFVQAVCARLFQLVHAICARTVHTFCARTVLACTCCLP